MNASLPPPPGAHPYAALYHAMTCPLTGQVMRDPVILAVSGFSYERSAIEAHLRDIGTNPFTGARLEDDQRRLLPNPGLRETIQFCMARYVNRQAAPAAEAAADPRDDEGPAEETA